jgi:cytochrome c5
VKNLLKVLSSTMLALLVVFSANAAMDENSIRERTMPVGNVCIEGDDCGFATAAVASGPREASDIYQTSCFGCHGTGALGAPKYGDVAAWSERAAKGVDTLIMNAIVGINAMPPRGTCGTCSDDDIAKTVQYMLDNSK